MTHDGFPSASIESAADQPDGINIPTDTGSFQIVGVRRIMLDIHEDSRGALGEIHRDSWHNSPRPLQWDFIKSKAKVLRGAHVHRRRWDYLTFLSGTATIGLCDLRRDSASFRKSLLIEAQGDVPSMLLVPPGVIHGIYCHTACTYLYGLTDYYDGTDQDGCFWNDPALSLDWPNKNPTVIERDRHLGSFSDLLHRFEARGGVSPDAG